MKWGNVTGAFGERNAREYLRRKGYEILTHNFRCREGEVDIIARHGAYIVFVEVKTRKSRLYGEPCEAVDFRKQGKIMLAAQQYMEKHQLDLPMRFDVCEVFYRKNGSAHTLRDINHIEQAF